MNIRPASFRDMARIESLHRDSVQRDDSRAQVAEDSPVPQATLLRVWHAVTKSLTALVPLTDASDALLVAEDPTEGVVGYIQAQAPRGRTKAWQILGLAASSSGPGHFARQRLIEALCNLGLERGVHTFHVRLPLDHPLVPIFLEEHFTQLATEQIVYRDEPPRAQHPGSALLRPAKRDDIPAIHLLYLRTTPSQVANFEGPSLKAWLAAFAQGDVSRLGRDDTRHYVAEHPGVVGWAAIKPSSATRPAQLSLMCDGHDEQLRESFIDAVVAELPSGPVACVLRHYDSELIRSLRQRGFETYGTQLLLVRELGSRVRLRQTAAEKKPILARAGVAQSVPATEGHVSLRVLTTSRQRREK
ncbi:MAG: hypothetical protein ABR498_03820 [Candidatus Dormibacteria bacterium]